MKPKDALHHGDALELLPTFPPASFDAIVTDPPYCSGGLTAAERTRPASKKYVQSRQKTRWPEFESESMDQAAWAQGRTAGSRNVGESRTTERRSWSSSTGGNCLFSPPCSSGWAGGG